MIFLILTILASYVAAVIGDLISRYLKRGLQTIVALIVIIGILVHLLPETLTSTGFTGLGLFACGYLLPLIIERLFSVANVTRWTHLFTSLAFALLYFHAILDGIALSIERSTLSLFVMLHRLPEGIFIWSASRQRFERKSCWWVLHGLTIMTLFGYLTGKQQAIWQILPSFYYFQAFICGSLIHVGYHAFHFHRPQDNKKLSGFS